MAWRRLAPIVLASLLAMLCFAATALGATRVYWGNGTANKISSVNLDGTGGADLDTGQATVENPLGLAIDAAAGRIYWMNFGAGKISYANLDGSGGGDFDPGQPVGGLALGFAIDPAARRIYWANTTESKISYASLDGSGGGVLDTGQATLQSPAGLAIDAAAGRIYWANLGGGISFANLDGSGGGDLFMGGATAGFLSGLAIDPASGRIYWIDSALEKLVYVNLDGTGSGELFISGAAVEEPVGLAIDPAARRIYWGNFGGEAISYANLDGSGGGSLDTGAATAGGTATPVLLEPPAPVTPPGIAGGGTPGSMLACGGASWRTDLPAAFLFRAPSRFAYDWSLDGAPIAGASGSSILATSPGGYRCTVSASNAAGAAAQVSALHLVSSAPAPTATPAPPPLAAAVVSGSAAVVSGSATVRKGRARLRLRCPGPGECHGTLKLLYRQRLERGRASARRPARIRRIRFGSATFALSAGKAAIASVELSRKAMKLLREAGGRGLKAQLRGSGIEPRTVKLKPAKKQRHRRRS